MRFALFAKTFLPDIDRFAALLASVDAFRRDATPFVVSVPRREQAVFASRFGTDRITWLVDEDLVGRSIEQNWVTQQLVKLYAYRTDFADAWCLVDSDFAFIRDFSSADFVDGQGRVALVASPWLNSVDPGGDTLQRFLAGDPAFALPELASARIARRRAPRGLSVWTRVRDRFGTFDVVRAQERIRRTFGGAGPSLSFMPSPVWTRESLRTMEHDWLQPRGLRFEDLVWYSPWEAIWVGEWELWRGAPGRYLCHPSFLGISSDAAAHSIERSGTTVHDIARRYLGVAVAARHCTVTSLRLSS